MPRCLGLLAHEEPAAVADRGDAHRQGVGAHGEPAHGVEAVAGLGDGLGDGLAGDAQMAPLGQGLLAVYEVRRPRPRCELDRLVELAMAQLQQDREELLAQWR